MADDVLHELHQHAVALRRLAAELVGGGYADDVLQDAAIEALRAPPRAPGPFAAWWQGVVRNLASKRRRAAAVRRRHEAAAARADVGFVEAGAETADTLRWLLERVAALPEPYRSTLLARYVRDLSPNAIAAQSGVPVRTVKTRLQRGLALLRASLQERGDDWRAALGLAFGWRAPAAPTATAAAVTGIHIMNATTKGLFAAGSLVLLGVGVWLVLAASPSATTGAGDTASELLLAARTDHAPAAAPPAESMAHRSLVTPPVAANVGDAAAAGGDAIVVHVVDATSGEPVTRFGLREHRTPQPIAFGVQESTLHHAGEHADGRVVVPVAFFEQRNFVVEAVGLGYLPSRWFDAADAAARGGERVVEVRLPRPVDVAVRVVRERTGEPIAGTKVELLRRWPTSPELSLRTVAVTSNRLRAQPDESPLMFAFTSGRALLLTDGATDREGRVRLRVPPDEDLVLRLLGPGHQPAIRQPWRVAAAAAGTEVVASVTTGATIQGRVFPIDAARRLQAELAPKALANAPLAARYGTGLRLRKLGTEEQRPAGGSMFAPPLPLADDGTFVVDGLTAGDWELRVCYAMHVQPEKPRQPLGTTAPIEIVAAEIRGLAENELRIVDIDVTGWASGSLDASIVRDGMPVTSGTVFARPIATNGAPLPDIQTTLNLRFYDSGRLPVTLPPARYFARLHELHKPDVPLGEFTLHSGQTTRVDFVVGLVTVSLRFLEADGTPASGVMATLSNAGWWSAGAETDAAGLATIVGVLRGDRLAVGCRRPTGNSQGAPYGPPIEIGTLRAGEVPGPIEFRLPPR